MVLAKRFLFDQAFEIPVTPISPAGFTLTTGNDPFINPGVYAVYDNEFDCTEPGRYCWHVPQETNVISRIVLGDIYETLSAMCWCKMQGNSQNGLAFRGIGSLSHWAKASHLSISCQKHVEWCRAWLEIWGYTVRQVHVVTTGPLTNIDDGHVVLEVEIDGKWRMFDAGNHRWFTEAGEHIDHVRFMELVAADTPPDKHTLSPQTFTADLYDGQWCYATYGDMAWRFDDDMWNWYRRIFQSVTAIA
ncbi:MAG: hypothetical protein ACR2RF_26400 [Geminicoccaceae bacterium]